MPDIDSAHFRQVLGHFPTGVTVITAAGPEGKPAGFAVGSFFSVSLEPPLVGFCAGKASSSWPGIRDAGSFCVNILAEDQEAVMGATVRWAHEAGIRICADGVETREQWEVVTHLGFDFAQGPYLDDVAVEPAGWATT